MATGTGRGYGKCVHVGMAGKVSSMALYARATSPAINQGTTKINGALVGTCTRTIYPGAGGRIMTVGTVIVMNDGNHTGTDVAGRRTQR